MLDALAQRLFEAVDVAHPVHTDIRRRSAKERRCEPEPHATSHRYLFTRIRREHHSSADRARLRDARIVQARTIRICASPPHTFPEGTLMSAPADISTEKTR